MPYRGLKALNKENTAHPRKINILYLCILGLSREELNIILT